MTTNEFSLLLSGAILLGNILVGLFFWRFWTKMRDRLFALFALAFWVLALERVLLLSVGTENEIRPSVYVVRLIAFLLIAGAVIDKNRASHR